MPAVRNRCEYPGCTKRGRGDPPVCLEHEEEIAAMEEEYPGNELLNEFMDNPRVREIFEKGSSVLDSIKDLVEKVKVGQMPHQNQPPPQRPRPNDKALERQARMILHFDPNEQLTVDKIKQRRKDLAAMAHPDKGGSTEAMQRINASADLLLKTVKS